jgi:hypothetical protein
MLQYPLIHNIFLTSLPFLSEIFYPLKSLHDFSNMMSTLTNKKHSGKTIKGSSSFDECCDILFEDSINQYSCSSITGGLYFIY